MPKLPSWLTAILAALLATLVIAGALLIAVGVLSAFKVDPMMSLPVLAILGVLLLLAALAGVSVSFGHFGLSDKQQALALPEGSIRAVIAMALVVIFAILTVFLYGTLANGNVDTQAADFAKQLLTLIGTLMTAVTAFYFGAKTATSAAAAVSGDTSPKPPLTLRSIDPTTRARADGPISLTIAGDNLNTIASVKIVQNQTQIAATGVHSNPNSVVCTVPIDANTAVGVWDVVVVDADTRSEKLSGALTIA